MKHTGLIETESDFRIKLESEDNEDIFQLMKLSNATLKPVRTFGRINSTGAYVWFCIPKRKERRTDTSIGNDK